MLRSSACRPRLTSTCSISHPMRHRPHQSSRPARLREHLHRSILHRDNKYALNAQKIERSFSRNRPAFRHSTACMRMRDGDRRRARANCPCARPARHTSAFAAPRRQYSRTRPPENLRSRGSCDTHSRRASALSSLAPRGHRFGVCARNPPRREAHGHTTLPSKHALIAQKQQTNALGRANVSHQTALHA